MPRWTLSGVDRGCNAMLASDLQNDWLRQRAALVWGPRRRLVCEMDLNHRLDGGDIYYFHKQSLSEVRCVRCAVSCAAALKHWARLQSLALLWLNAYSKYCRNDWRMFFM